MGDDITFVINGDLPYNNLFIRIIFILLLMYFVGYNQWRSQ